MKNKRTISVTPVSRTLLLLIAYIGFVICTRGIVVLTDLPRSLIGLTVWPILITPHIFSRRVTYSMLITNVIILITAILTTERNINGLISVTICAIMVALISEITFTFRSRHIQLAENLKLAIAKARKADEAKGVFLANMSHEIRTPISGIIGVSDMLRSEKMTDHQHELLSVISDSSDVLLNIVNNILDYSKIEAGKLTLAKEPYCLERLLTKVVRNFELLSATKGLSLISDIPDDLPQSIIGDKYRFRQILTNLLGNAVKYTDEGTITFQVQSRKIENELTLLITVSDTGIGIPDNKLNSLFAPFEQGDSSYRKTAQGTGLGLAITKVLTEEMDGRISVSSAINKGTTFHVEFTFPISPNAPQNDELALYNNLNDISDANQILIAEDNKVNQLYLTHFLEREGFNVTLAENGQEAVDYVKQRSFDAILMDIQMPVLSGLEATSEIRAFEEDQSRPYTPIFALTASVTEHDRNRILAAGIDHFCPKPVDMRALLNSLKRILD